MIATLLTTRCREAEPLPPSPCLSRHFSRQSVAKDSEMCAEQIERVMQATVEMYGDMQAIAGKTLQEIEGLEMKALGEGDKSES